MKYLYRLFLLIVFTTFINASLLQENIKNILGERTYQINKFLILDIFKDEDNFYLNENLKYEEIFKLLKENGLLNLKFKYPKDVNIEFTSNSKTIKVIKTIKDVLLNLGYSYYFTNSISRYDDKLIWKIHFKSESMLDPVEFMKQLNLLNVKVIDINKISNSNWKYKIDVNYVNILNSIDIAKNEVIKLKKPHRNYVLDVHNVHQLKVVSHRLNQWYPSLTFYNQDFDLLGLVEENKVYKGIKLDVPTNTKYIIISDTYNLINIKRGLTVIVR